MTHTVTMSDNLQLLSLDVGDFVETPSDDEFEWSIRWQGETLFEAVPGQPAGHERYRVTRAGGTHLIVSGIPKCFKLDGGCGTSQRELTIFTVTH
jgi:hypothetical protein